MRRNSRISIGDRRKSESDRSIPPASERRSSVSALSAKLQDTLKFRRRTSLTADEQLVRSESNSQSPLLTLPPEIRRLIWDYALGGSVIDVGDTPLPGSGHGGGRPIYPFSVCAGDTLCTVASFLRAVDAGRRVRIRDSTHGAVTCSADDDRRRRGSRSAVSKARRRWLALLFVCRQVSLEAAESVWSCNMLFFWDPETAWRFACEVRTAAQAACVRSLGLLLELVPGMYAVEVGRAARRRDEERMEEMAARLTGLRRLYLLIKLPVDLIIRADDCDGGWKNIEWLKGIWKLAALDLREVRVVVDLPKEVLKTRSWGGDKGEILLRKKYRITDEDVASYARGLELFLLGQRASREQAKLASTNADHRI